MNKRKIGIVASMAGEGRLRELANLALWSVESKFRVIHMHSSPVKATIEPTTLCNLRCKMCLQSFWKPEFLRNMKFEDFKKIINQFDCLEVLVLSGLGEPLLNKDLFRMIKYAKEERGIEFLEFFTNAMLMNEQACRNILDCGVDFISISFDGATKKTYESIRRGGNFELVINNIKSLVRMRGGRNKPKINIGLTVTKENAHEVLDVVRLAKALGVDSMTAGDLNPDLVQRKEMAYESPEELRFAVKKLSQKIGFDVFFSDEKGSACSVMWDLPYITVDGYIVPCCFKPDPRAFNFGNVLEEPFSKLWNGKDVLKFRKELRNKKCRPALCINCPHLMYREVG